MSKKYGYARVSTLKQKLELQIEALQKEGCDEIFSEKISGKNKERREFLKLLSIIQPGDTIVVTKLDRASRSLRDLLNILSGLTSRQVIFKSLHENIETGTITGKLLLNILGTIAEFERDLINERTTLGREAARESGVKFGRPFKITKEVMENINRFSENGNSIKEIAMLTGLSVPSVYRALSQSRKAKEQALKEEFFGK